MSCYFLENEAYDNRYFSVVFIFQYVKELINIVLAANYFRKCFRRISFNCIFGFLSHGIFLMYWFILSCRIENSLFSKMFFCAVWKMYFRYIVSSILPVNFSSCSFIVVSDFYIFANGLLIYSILTNSIFSFLPLRKLRWLIQCLHR